MPFPSQTDDYKVNLEVFEGPLDLLLYLIRRDELDIYDIPIARITEQYREYLAAMQSLDLNVAGEFVVMAATLELIKSRMLLPDDEEAVGDDEEDGRDPRWDLVRQLVEYKRFKEAAERLEDKESERMDVFTAGGSAAVVTEAGEGEVAWGSVKIADLVAAFAEVLSKAPVDPVGEIEPVLWTVPDKIRVIETLVARSEKRGIAFSSLFKPTSHRGEIIVTFLALLELLRQHRVAAVQGGPFADIQIREWEPEPVPEPEPGPAPPETMPGETPENVPE